MLPGRGQRDGVAHRPRADAPATASARPAGVPTRRSPNDDPGTSSASPSSASARARRPSAASSPGRREAAGRGDPAGDRGHRGADDRDQDRCDQHRGALTRSSSALRRPATRGRWRAAPVEQPVDDDQARPSTSGSRRTGSNLCTLRSGASDAVEQRLQRRRRTSPAPRPCDPASPSAARRARRGQEQAVRVAAVAGSRPARASSTTPLLRTRIGVAKQVVAGPRGRGRGRGPSPRCRAARRRAWSGTS